MSRLQQSAGAVRIRVRAAEKSPTNFGAGAKSSLEAQTKSAAFSPVLTRTAPQKLRVERWLIWVRAKQKKDSGAPSGPESSALVLPLAIKGGKSMAMVEYLILHRQA